jgi:hypothetical protein
MLVIQQTFIKSPYFTYIRLKANLILLISLRYEYRCLVCQKL